MASAWQSASLQGFTHKGAVGQIELNERGWRTKFFEGTRAVVTMRVTVRGLALLRLVVAGFLDGFELTLSIDKPKHHFDVLRLSLKRESPIPMVWKCFFFLQIWQ